MQTTPAETTTVTNGRASSSMPATTTYQPIVGVTNGQLHGFVPTPNPNLTDFETLEVVLQQLVRWQRVFEHDAPAIAIDVSSSNGALEALDYVVRGQLRRFNVNPSGLTLQIPEADAVSSIGTDDALQLRSLSDLGVRISVIGFGTGITSLQQLRSISAHALQIDSSFIEEIANDSEAVGFARAIVEVGRSFGLTTIADGVTTKAQQHILRSIGCEQMRGTAISPPLSSLEATDLIESVPKRPW